MLVCGHCGKPTKVAKMIMDDGSKVRSCKKCGEIIDTVSKESEE
jgi:large subunit ribosomal protein L24